MERIATTTLRRTCRSAIRSNKSRTPCLASRICPARFLCSSPSQSSSPSSTPRPRTPIRRQLAKQYSTESSIQGTIGKGEEGIRDEVVRERVVLSAPEYLNEKEAEIFGLLAKELEPVELEVQDISGGCGSMYGISITSEKFRGLGMLKQQRLVNAVLGEQIKGWHGVQLRTKTP